MLIGAYLKQKRIAKGMSDVELSKITGISTNNIFDLEEYENEIDMYAMNRIKALCDALSIKMSDIFEQLTDDYKDLSSSEIVMRRRSEMGISVKELSDRIGYEEIVIEVIENNGDLQQVCLDAFKNIACQLDLPLSFLLNKLAVSMNKR
jgi:DNA-binding Xre family transcriptional regulator